MPYSVMIMHNGRKLSEQFSPPQESELAERFQGERFQAIFKVHRQMGVGNFLLGLAILSMLSSEVPLETGFVFIAGIAVMGAARHLLYYAYLKRWKKLATPVYGWFAVAIDFVTGLFWAYLFHDSYLSLVPWDLAVALLGIGLTSFPAVLMGIWMPAALSYPLSTSLGITLVYWSHWTSHSLSLMTLTWTGFVITVFLAQYLGRSQAAEMMLRLRLSANESRFRQIAVASPIPTAVLRRDDGGLLFGNERLAGLMGMARDNLAKRTLWDIVARREDRQELMDELAQRNCVEDRECVLNPQPGRHLVAHLSLVPLEIEGESMLMMTLRDVTQDNDLRKAQVAARMAAESALATERRAVEEQRHFLAMVAHEFRTPLSIISTTLDVLEMTGENLRPEVASAYDRIRRATERLVRLIETCLNEDRLVDIGTLTREPFDLLQVLMGVLRDSRGGTNAAKIEASLPETPLTVVGDKALIKIALANLVDNAEKYTKQDGRITVRLTPYGDQAIVQVSDTGIGIPQAELPRIFDKYYRAPGAKGIAGAGLGLNLVKRIIELHGGQIQAASTPGQGSTFTVRLPVVAGADEA